jgi:hypothetical protein
MDISSTQSKVQEGQISEEVALAAGKAGSLTTRTGDTAGEATLSAGHGILTGDKVDIYWDGGEQHGATVGTVAGAVVPFTGGVGTVLPIATTALVVTKQVVINIDFEGDDVAIIVINTTQRAGVDIRDGVDASLKALTLATGASWIWVEGSDATNPLAGATVASMTASCGSATTAATLKVGVLYSSVA